MEHDEQRPAPSAAHAADAAAAEAAQEAASTAQAAEMVTGVAPRRPVREHLQAAGLEIRGFCEGLSRRPELMQRSDLLQDFTAAEADILGREMLLVRAAPGQRLIAEDEPSDWMMLLLSGTVDVAKRRVGAAPGSEAPADLTRLAVLRPGAVMGEMSMLDGEPRYASCWALSEVEAAVLTRNDVARLVQAHPGVSAKLLVKITQLLAQRLRNTSNQLIRVLRMR
jgi:CRP/FNR family transcriptional regulator, cyclic AMP receptor protein